MLLTGAAGLLGHWLRETKPEAVALTALVHRQRLSGPHTVVADLRSPDNTVRAVAPARPDLVIHAAYAKDRASIVDATEHIASAAAEVGAAFIHVSTDAVFSGDGVPRTENDRPDPVWDYGVWKVESEQLATLEVPDAAIVRLPLVVSVDPADHVVRRIQAAAAEDTTAEWFRDEFRQPASAEDIAHALWRIAARPRHTRAGVWHLPGPETLSRLDIAQRVAAHLRLDGSVNTGATTPAPANRPRHLQLRGDRARHQIAWAPASILS